MLKNLETLIVMSDEIILAKKQSKPIVALESTIITHGMPFPENYNTAIQAETIVRRNGAVPATIAVINGRIKIGLSEKDIKKLSKDRNTHKLSTNNLSMGVAKGQNGSTTVAATIAIAKFANISVFATGGIGGAHRGSEINFDISADLKQLASSPINVICAGPKAILDIPKTVELLEGLGVPLITYQSKNIPAFWSRDSGVPSPVVAKTVKEIVQSYVVRSQLGFQAAQLICNPIPRKYEINRTVIEPLIEHSIKHALEKNIQGKDVTPFLLAEVLERTNGKSLEANKALLFNNIDLATKIANTLSQNRHY